MVGAFTTKGAHHKDMRPVLSCLKNRRADATPPQNSCAACLNSVSICLLSAACLQPPAPNKNTPVPCLILFVQSRSVDYHASVSFFSVMPSPFKLPALLSAFVIHHITTPPASRTDTTSAPARYDTCGVPQHNTTFNAVSVRFSFNDRPFIPAASALQISLPNAAH